MKSQSNCFIVQTSNDLFYFFYSPDGNICYSLYNNECWSKPISIIEDVNYNFSVSLSNNDDIYIFCQDLLGNVILCLYQNQNWTSKKILENKSSDIYNINFQMIGDSNSFNLIYSMPIAEEKNAQLVYHSMDNNKWSSPQILDNIIPLKPFPFILESVNSNLYIAFYQKQTKNHCLGYREFSTILKKWSKFNSFNETLYTYLDQSFLVTDDAIYALYIVKGNFSSQLIYKYKKDTNWSMPYILYEANKIDLCSLFIVDNQLWVIWCINSYVYTSVSYNMGKTFTKTQIHYYNDSLYKASFITNKRIKKEAYINELLIYGQPIPKILFIPELYRSLYNINSTSKQEEKEETKTTYIEEEKEKLDILKNKISIYENQLNEKENQINLLIEEKNLLLQTKNSLENQLTQKNIELEEQRKQLQNFKKEKKTIILPYDFK